MCSSRGWPASSVNGPPLWCVSLFASALLPMNMCHASRCHKLLGVANSADAKELKRAYRREALKWHPDKNSAPEAEEKFREISHCYETLSSPGSGRRQNGREGSGFAGDGGMEMYDRQRAFRTFDDLFGDVHQSWRPGATVTGTIVSGGKRVTITIYPDGTTDEREETRVGGGSYSSMYKKDGGNIQISINGDPREFMLDMMRTHLPLPGFIMSTLSMVMAFVCNPLVCCGGCLYMCCFRGKARTD